jgi:alkanesulfonate monooxygenase SsuD/methylene tetrahydromethanopterin reductase-like flavin-dependent oxidoreductase (luciferase family)
MAEFPHLIDEVIGFLHHSWPPGHRFETLEMSPRIPTPPGLFVLGASENGARIAAERGLPFVYGHHLGLTKSRPAAVERYRAEFTGERPYLIASVNVVCADTDEQAEHEAMAVASAEIRRREGDVAEPRLRYLAGQALEDAQMIRGGPRTVVEEIHHLADRLGVDEIMLVPFEQTAAARSRTLRLVAQAHRAAVPTGTRSA